MALVSAQREQAGRQREKTRVLFVNSPSGPSGIRTNLSFGHLCLASSLPDRFESRFFDATALPLDELKGFLGQFKPHVVALNIYEKNALSVLKAVEKIKGWLPRAKVVVGGPYATEKPERAIIFSGADAVVRGEAEIRLPGVIDALLLKNQKDSLGALSRIEGVLARHPKTGEFVGSKVGSFHPPSSAELEKMPLKWGLWKDHLPTMVDFVTSRGCPWGCYFCSNPHGRQHRAISAERVLFELGQIRERLPTVKSVRFSDDTFTLRRKRLLDIANGVRARGLHKHFVFGVQTDVCSLLKKGKKGGREVDLEAVRALKRMNVRAVHVGVESYSNDELKRLGKSHYTVSEALEVNKALASNGIKVINNLILSNVDTRPIDLLKVFFHSARIKRDFGRKIEVSANTNIVPLEHTQSYHDLKERGLLGQIQGGQGIKPSGEYVWLGEAWINPIDSLVRRALDLPGIVTNEGDLGGEKKAIRFVVQETRKELDWLSRLARMKSPLGAREEARLTELKKVVKYYEQNKHLLK